MTSEKDINTTEATSHDNEINNNEEETPTSSASETIDSNNQEEHSTENNHDNEEKEDEKDPLEAAQQEIENLKDQYLRKVAEFENYRKRTLKEKTDLILNGAEKTVEAILPVVDDMERAVAGAESSDDVAAVIEGFELVFKKLMKALEGLGVRKIETNDKDFDTDFHEAIAMVPGVDDDKKGKVIDCVQTGYTLNDKVIRHAKVAVGQ